MPGRLAPMACLSVAAISIRLTTCPLVDITIGRGVALPAGLSSSMGCHLLNAAGAYLLSTARTSFLVGDSMAILTNADVRVRSGVGSSGGLHQLLCWRCMTKVLSRSSCRQGGEIGHLQSPPTGVKTMQVLVHTQSLDATRLKYGDGVESKYRWSDKCFLAENDQRHLSTCMHVYDLINSCIMMVDRILAWAQDTRATNRTKTRKQGMVQCCRDQELAFIAVLA